MLAQGAAASKGEIMPLSKATRPDQPTAANRRDLARYVTSVPARSVRLERAEHNATSGRPVPAVWAPQDDSYALFPKISPGSSSAPSGTSFRPHARTHHYPITLRSGQPSGQTAAARG
jgi:hypothetical protein